MKRLITSGLQNSVTVKSNFLSDFIIKKEWLAVWFQSKILYFPCLINLTGNIRQALDEGYIRCGTFVDLQEAFSTSGWWNTVM